MALATTPILPTLRPACKRQIVKRQTTDETSNTCLSILLNLDTKRETMCTETYDNSVAKIAKLIISKVESYKIFGTFCGLTFLDRYQDTGAATIASTMLKVDAKISEPSWKMEQILYNKCNELLTRMSMIENLSSLDADLVCTLCRFCKLSNQKPFLSDLLLEIGRSVWPYIKQSLQQHTEWFVDFIADIFEAVGYRLELLYPNNFGIGWNVIRDGLVMTKSNYSALRLLAVIEHKCRKWHLPDEVLQYYRKQYNELTDTRKKEFLALVGSVSSKRKTSLSAKPGRSAADFLRRRQSVESQEADEGGFEVFERSASVSSPDSSTASVENESLTEPQKCPEERSLPYHHRHNLLQEHKRRSYEDLKRILIDGNAIQDSHKTERNVDVSEQKECVNEQNENVDEPASEKINDADIWEETGSIWLQENENTPKENALLPSLRIDSLSDGTNKNKSFMNERKREIVKVWKGYVGKVIGTHGSVITAIQNETGARVNIVRHQGDKVAQRPAFSVGTMRNMIHNTLGIPLNRTTSMTDDEMIQKEEQEEFEFEIIGTEETIEKAKLRIQSIITNAKCSYNRHENLKRSYSTGDEASFSGGFRRSFYQDRKKVIVKVEKKYVGRVIGTGGSMIMAIEEKTGAKVTFVKDKRAERYKGMEKEKVLEQRKEEESKTEEKTTQLKEESEKAEQAKIEKEAVHEEVNGAESESEVSTGCQEKTDGEFEISGTDEAIEKAKNEIKKLVDNNFERKTFSRSYSYSAPRRGFEEFHRSLSCPITNWGESCVGDCSSCQKGSYCRSFLLVQSVSPFCWVRPEALALTQDTDWAEFIVKTKVDDPTLWRPRKSSDTSTCSTEDITSDCSSPRDFTADYSTDVTAGSPEPAENILGGNTTPVTFNGNVG